MRLLHLFFTSVLGVGLAGCSSASTLASTSAPGGGDAGASPAGGDGGHASEPAECSSTDQDVDADRDGFTPNQGDCDDCSAQINPGAYDFPSDAYDQDCSGTRATTKEVNCDEGLALDSTDPKDAARSIGLCKFTTADGKDWGVIDAKFVLPDGSASMSDPMQVGLLPRFGAAIARQGENLLALSSGVARAPGQRGYTEACDVFNAPADLASALECILLGSCPGQETAPTGFPKASKACGGNAGGENSPIFNGVALELKIRVPTNAKSFAFESIFYSYEFPDYLCQSYNDFFLVLKEPAPANMSDGNIVFDSHGEPIGVNTGLLAVCDPKDLPANAPSAEDCSQGAGLLEGSGFGAGEATCAEEGGTAAGVGSASTGWLKTRSPVDAGQIITLRFAIWDTGDAVLDSTALVDHFVWSLDDTQVTTVPVL